MWTICGVANFFIICYNNDIDLNYIKDTGIGINKTDRKKLFEKFSRGKNAISQNPSGTGLGLFIAKKIIGAHSGKIEIESDGIGKGTEVKIFLAVKHNK